MKIQNSETEITGSWLMKEGRVINDEASYRINDLISTYLLKLGKDISGWNTLYRDPYDGRYWELIYPQSEIHGGGPPQLRCIKEEEIKNKYHG
ncbi:MAG: hypothetical protein IPP74_00790 [Alphaproteobacteria bacterium]|nr:hypothetical protein [Alphaproteobacteria bacterium]